MGNQYERRAGGGISHTDLKISLMCGDSLVSALLTEIFCFAVAKRDLKG